ncbi:MAG: DUF1415 domain-containing protein [Granulosicoccaceae bacterium]
MHPTHNTILANVTAWVETMVIGLELCPFAPKVKNSGELNLKICGSTDTEGVIIALIEETARVLAAGGDTTTLLILPKGFADFDDYLDLLAAAEELLVLQKLDSQVQLASFHPLYVFEGSDDCDPANYSNRSPYPILHLLQEESVTRGVDHYPDIHMLATRNIARLENMGMEAIVALSKRYLG